MTLKVGDTAPDFTLPTDGGGSVTLSRFRGKKVLLYFYPKDDTTGCTKQACAFRDSDSDFANFGAVIIGVSKDSVASHDKFKKKYSLPSSSPPTRSRTSASATASGCRRACTGASTWASSARPSSSTRRA